MRLLPSKNSKPEFSGVDGQSVIGISKNRYEHIHVRLSSAILGLRHFWKGAHNGPSLT